MVKQELIPAHVPLFLLFAPLLCAKELRSCCCCSSLQSKIKEKLGKILMFLCGFYFLLLAMQQCEVGIYRNAGCCCCCQSCCEFAMSEMVKELKNR